MSRRLCFALDLVDDADLIAEYEAAHAAGAVWPEVVQGIRQSGYEAMEIWRSGDRLMLIAEVRDDFPRAIDPALAVIDAKWQEKMDRFQKRLAHGAADEKWTPMTRIFSLDEQVER